MHRTRLTVRPIALYASETRKTMKADEQNVRVIRIILVKYILPPPQKK